MQSDVIPVMGFIALFIVFFVINIVGLVFWIWMIIDCAQNEPSGDNIKVVWLLVVILVGWIGALIYFFVRRPERIRQYGR